MSSMTIPEQSGQEKAPQWCRIVVPLAIIAIIAALPPPQGLEQHTWYYFAIFSGVIVGLVFEPLPNAAVGLIGVTAVVVLSRWTLFGAAEIAKPGFNIANEPIKWALSNFNPAQRAECVRLSSLGGSQSYVEPLTCLEIAKAATKFPPVTGWTAATALKTHVTPNERQIGFVTLDMRTNGVQTLAAWCLGRGCNDRSRGARRVD